MDKQILYKFFEGTATVEEKSMIMEWEESSPENHLKLIQERRTFDTTGLLAEEPVTKKTIRFYRKDIIWKVASLLLLLSNICLFVYFTGRKDEIVAMQTITVPAGQRINIDLPDGSNVWLNARTTLSYPINFGKNNRLVELDGEAYFDVIPSDEKPFQVNTSKGVIEVLGTVFNIEAYSREELFETTLLKGKVSVKQHGDSDKELILIPGYKSILKDGRLEIQRVMDYDHYRWTEGLICFRNEPFSGIMKAFEKYYGKKIEISDEKLLRYHFTGKFRQTEGIDHALRVLQKDLRFTYTRDDEMQIIYIQ